MQERFIFCRDFLTQNQDFLFPDKNFLSRNKMSYEKDFLDSPFCFLSIDRKEVCHYNEV
jgi:hypothetical protein